LLDGLRALPADHAVGAAELRLFHLGQAVMEVAVEYFGQPDVRDRFYHARWRIAQELRTRYPKGFRARRRPSKRRVGRRRVTQTFPGQTAC
jgi:NAD-dependent DNA ligase